MPNLATKILESVCSYQPKLENKASVPSVDTQHDIISKSILNGTWEKSEFDVKKGWKFCLDSDHRELTVYLSFKPNSKLYVLVRSPRLERIYEGTINADSKSLDYVLNIVFRKLHS